MTNQFDFHKTDREYYADPPLPTVDNYELFQSIPDIGPKALKDIPQIHGEASSILWNYVADQGVYRYTAPYPIRTLYLQNFSNVNFTLKFDSGDVYTIYAGGFVTIYPPFTQSLTAQSTATGIGTLVAVPFEERAWLVFGGVNSAAGGGAAANVIVTNFPAGFNVNNFPVSFQVSNFPTGFNVNNFPAGFNVNNTVSVIQGGSANAAAINGTVGTTATALAIARATRTGLRVNNDSAVDMRVAPTASPPTTTTGERLPSGASASYDAVVAWSICAVSGSGNAFSGIDQYN